MAAYISSGQDIPASRFSCPANDTGVEYSAIPFGNMSVSVFANYHTTNASSPANGSFYDGYCGIKGYHPRMYQCCNYGNPFAPEDDGLNKSIALAAEDSCSQYCAHPGNLNVWVYCLTLGGETVRNAFCRLTTGAHIETSGSGIRYGPPDPSDESIDSIRGRSKLGGSATVKAEVYCVWIAMGLVSIMLAVHGAC